MPLPLNSPPRSICILRLSAIGDVSHTLPIVRTIQRAWPDTKITWVIGEVEYQLVYDIPNIEFVVFDKKKGVKGYYEIYQAFKGRRFDVLLHMQMSIRASIASLMIPAHIRLGFDRARAKDMQWLFTNQQIEAKKNQHVIDSFFGFSEALGISEHILSWEIPIPEKDRAIAHKILPEGKYIVISPCSSMSYRNWSFAGYSEVARYIINKLGLNVVLCGGNSELEARYAKYISKALGSSDNGDKLVDLVGKTNLKQLLEILNQSEALISPDAGPAHLATAVNTPVIGLYACTNPERARPYLSKGFVVNRYPEAIQQEYGKSVEELPWGSRVKKPEAMLLIKEADVCTMLEKLLRKNNQNQTI